MRRPSTRPAPDAYPIAALTFILVYQDQADAAKGKALADFLTWAIHRGAGPGGSARLRPTPRGDRSGGRAVDRSPDPGRKAPGLDSETNHSRRGGAAQRWTACTKTALAAARRGGVPHRRSHRHRDHARRAPVHPHARMGLPRRTQWDPVADHYGALPYLYRHARTPRSWRSSSRCRSGSGAPCSSPSWRKGGRPPRCPS